MRASTPLQAAVVDRDGVRIAYEVPGQGGPTLFMIPPAPITHSSIDKAKVPCLARHFWVVTIDGRGNDRSDRPTDPAAHRRAEALADLLTALDGTGTYRAVLVGQCTANWWPVEVAHTHAWRVAGPVAIDPGVPHIGPVHQHWIDTHETWDKVLAGPQGWELNDRQVYVTSYENWIDWFFSQQLVEPHSTKQSADAVEWALESAGEVLVVGDEGIAIDPPTRQGEMVDAIDHPVLVIHDDQGHLPASRARTAVLPNEPTPSCR